METGILAQAYDALRMELVTLWTDGTVTRLKSFSPLILGELLKQPRYARGTKAGQAMRQWARSSKWSV